MRMTKQGRNFAKDLFVTVIPVFLVILAFNLFYDNTPTGLGYTLFIGTILVFVYGIFTSIFKVKKWYK